LDEAFATGKVDDWKNLVVIDPKFYRAAEVDYLLGIPNKATAILGWTPQIEFKMLAERMVIHDVHEAGLQRSSLQAI
jgi:GDPmannose 4,6-dehydratase